MPGAKYPAEPPDEGTEDRLVSRRPDSGVTGWIGAWNFDYGRKA